MNLYKNIKPILPSFITHLLLLWISGLFAIFILPHGVFWAQQPHLPNPLLDIASRWDTAWYLSIAQIGYTWNAAAFFPLLPMLLHLFSFNKDFMAFAGWLLSILCFGGSLYVIRLLVLEKFNSQVADRAMWIIALFPGAIFLTAIYPMSLYLFLISLYFYFLIQNKPWLAGMAGLLAALTWDDGILLVLSGVFYSWYTSKFYRKNFKITARQAATYLGPVFGALGYLIFLKIRFGSFFAFLTAEHQWFRTFTVNPFYVQFHILWLLMINKPHL